MIGISTDDDAHGIAEFAKQTGAKFPLAWDEGGAVARRYEPSTMPTCYILDRNGIVRFVHVGFHTGDEKQIEQEVESLLR
jgi:peroxiredoxin